MKERGRRLPGDEQQTRIEAIEAILRAYAVEAAPSTAANPGIPYSFLLPDISRDIVTMCAGPARKYASRSLVHKKFKKMKALAKELHTEFRSDPSLSASVPLELAFAIIRVAHGELVLTKRSGAPQKNGAARIARLLAGHFRGLTGALPTRRTRLKEGVAQKAEGQFLNLLSEVYTALEIDASPESQAKSAIKFLAKTPSKN